MKELYELIVQTAKQRMEKEKETSVTDETFRLISLAIQMRPWI